MKHIFLVTLICCFVYSQDTDHNGVIDNAITGLDDFKGSGINNRVNITNLVKRYQLKIALPENMELSSPPLNFSQLWASPPGAFTNCWDGYIGYIDNDTLLDIAGFTFSPAKFYIWEQSPSRPDSFYLVQEFVKSEGGSFGPIIVGDTDGDGKNEIIAADVLGIARIYIYENNGNNVYVDQNTQNTLVHPSNSQGAVGLYIGDMNKNGKKEIILLRGSSSPSGGEVRIWEHSGSIGNPVYTNIYTYSTVTYLFGKGGFGDGDNDGWDEAYLTFGGFPTFNTFIRRIEFDSASGTFQHLQFEAPSIGLPASYKVYDLNNDNTKELIMTGNSNNRAAAYVFRSNGSNSFVKIDSIFEVADNNSMLSSDIKVLSGNSNPFLLMGSFNGRIYTYQYNGTNFIKDYENLNFPGSAIRRVYWLPTSSYDGYFNTWSGTNSNGTFYVFKRNDLIGIVNNEAPVEFRVFQNYPNPFNLVTHLRFEISKAELVKLTIFDITGKVVAILIDSEQQPGKHEISWNGDSFASGVYFYRLIAGANSETRTMMLVK